MSDEERFDHLTCHEAVRQLYAYLDQELSPDEEAAVRRHLEVCEGCFHHFEFDARLLETIREKARTGRAPERLRHKVTQLLDNL